MKPIEIPTPLRYILPLPLVILLVLMALENHGMLNFNFNVWGIYVIIGYTCLLAAFAGVVAVSQKQWSRLVMVILMIAVLLGSLAVYLTTPG